MIEHYPEILRATHANLVEAMIEADVSPDVAAEISLQVVEWIRKNWGGRTITRIWWQFDQKDRNEERGTRSEEEPELNLAPRTSNLEPAVIDPVKSVKGRELRAATMVILLHSLPVTLHPCRLAGIIAAHVEESLSLGIVYIPKGKNIDRLSRDHDIWRKFHWLGNIDQVIAISGLAQSQIYTIKRRIQEERDAREQPTLF